MDFAYQEQRVLANISMRVRAGDMVAIAGPNGSGKTTLLRLLSGSLQPVRGEVLLDGEDLRRVTARGRARRIALVSQQIDARLGFRVDEIVGMGRAPYVGLLGGPKEVDKSAVRRALHVCELLDHVDRRFDELSGGEQQRVMIAMALAQDPDFLLLDEPTVHLDLGHQHALLELLTQLQAERGVSIVAVMHDLNLAMLYFQTMALMYGGRLIALGPPGQVAASTGALKVFGAPLDQVEHPQTGAPQFLIRRGDATAD
ncbi:MAG: hypothetical protein DLM70_19730 [Chloroflexi bacterium]|nr:MAG: hypothetical protein DLM70_19730 [Chloroflexota bacterium]